MQRTILALPDLDLPAAPPSKSPEPKLPVEPEVRTAAVSAVSARWLARTEACRLAVIGTGVQARTSDRRPQAGKTGTAENYANAWFCGYTPDLATCVWIGYPAGNIPMTSVEGVSPVYGGTLPAQIWHDFMDVALKGVPPTPWPQPKTPAVLAPYRGVHAYDGGYTQPVAPAPTAPSTTTTTTTTQAPAPQPAPGKHP
jgi:penicillin-binding protein 1A